MRAQIAILQTSMNLYEKLQQINDPIPGTLIPFLVIFCLLLITLIIYIIAHKICANIRQQNIETNSLPYRPSQFSVNYSRGSSVNSRLPSVTENGQINVRPSKSYVANNRLAVPNGSIGRGSAYSPVSPSAISTGSSRISNNNFHQASRRPTYGSRSST